MSRIWICVFFLGLCHGVSRAADCNTIGKFPNDELADCRGFTTCTQIGDGLFYNYNLPCPATFIFNHFDNQCSNATGYQCLPEYNCTNIGNFDYERDSNCTSYIACINGLKGLVTARLIECPRNTVFNPLAGVCINETEYKCPRIKVTDILVTTENIITSASSQSLSSESQNNGLTTTATTTSTNEFKNNAINNRFHNSIFISCLLIIIDKVLV